MDFMPMNANQLPRIAAIARTSSLMRLASVGSKLLLAGGFSLCVALPAAAQNAHAAPAANVMAGSDTTASAQGGTASAALQKTDVRSQVAYERLLNNSGITLQWLWHAQRGNLEAKDTDGLITLDGTQANDEGTLKIKGAVVSISKDSFTFHGTILILDAPDKGRHCDRTGDYEFRITGNRKYWRLRQQEVCDGLADYVDIYF
jgi:hypothetical protein